MSSPPNSPSRLSVHAISNVFLKMRTSKNKPKPYHITCSSGPEPITSPLISPPIDRSFNRSQLSRKDDFVCVDAVDLVQLLRASRNTLYKNAQIMGANILIEESWSATICRPKNRTGGTFRVRISYSAVAACSKHNHDPRHPVALDQVKSVPGLMTIIERVE